MEIAKPGTATEKTAPRLRLLPCDLPDLALHLLVCQRFLGSLGIEFRGSRGSNGLRQARFPSFTQGSSSKRMAPSWPF